MPVKAEDSSFAHLMKSYDARGDDFPGGVDFLGSVHHADENHSSLDNFDGEVNVPPFRFDVEPCDVGYDGDPYDGDPWLDLYDGSYDGDDWDPYDGYDGADWSDPYDGYDDGDCGDPYDGYD